MNKNYKKIGIVFGLVSILILSSNILIKPSQSGDTQPPPGPNLLFYLQPGDIIFMDSNGGDPIYKMKNYPAEGINSNDHCAMFVGNNPLNTEYHDWCIHAGDPVNYIRLYGPDGLANGTRVNFSIYRVATATQNQKNAAIAWEHERVIQGCHWQNIVFDISKDWDNVRDPHLISSLNKFYCTELHWAAYYNTTWWAHQADPSKPIIDIDNNGFSIIPYDTHPCVNIGLSVLAEPIWILHWILNGEYPAYYNYAKMCEIKIDNDIQKIYPIP
jgi:hypothetical protein